MPQRWLNLSRLSDADKRRAWERIKEQNPALAELLVQLGEDEAAQRIIREFDADVLVPVASEAR